MESKRQEILRVLAPVQHEKACICFNSSSLLNSLGERIDSSDHILVDSYVSRNFSADEGCEKLVYVVRKRSEAELLIQEMSRFYNKTFKWLSPVEIYEKEREEVGQLRLIIAQYHVASVYHNYAASVYKAIGKSHYVRPVPEVDSDTLEWLRDTSCNDEALRLLLSHHLDFKLGESGQKSRCTVPRLLHNIDNSFVSYKLYHQVPWQSN